MSIEGAAREMPAGRLSNFEDADDGVDEVSDLSKILGPKKRPATTTPPPAGEVANEEPAPSAGQPASASRRKPAKRTGATGTTPKPSEARNVIRSSSIHIPADLIPVVTRYREEHHMSNGQVVIAAIEAAHPQLKELIHPETAGGTLFTKRATKGVRTNEGPLTPLNVRLFAQDYDVIDTLVRDLGAFSRGHLVTVSLQEFLT